jgi:hypothetical protein
MQAVPVGAEQAVRRAFVYRELAPCDRPGGPCRRRLNGRERVHGAVDNERRHREGRQVRPEVNLGVEVRYCFCDDQAGKRNSVWP